ncbi:helix-turn-helix transcriptional regulator [Actinokineospora sp. NBRC 105648]|uniref:helix-turn-helix domain-containing protein n=1 Tax=Actinokineospora sp. NBRC 105648 TaxID=3032206 RepID=UPI0024A14605|nr:helix-turn-helix transcriptional regulator [Actinokineospora sp. NBRC 105648]GLZ38123.1 hypothetical protein Acsp05_17470 [Actinokineospora sp. NBRC 105648]
MEQPAFGRRLRAVRLAKGLSQAALAAGGMSTGYLSRLESGARPPTPRAVRFLADQLGVPASAFDDTPPPSLSHVLALAVSAQDRSDLAGPLSEAVTGDGGRAEFLRWQALWRLAAVRRDEGERELEHELLVELVALGDRLDTAELRVRARVHLSACLLALDQADAAAARAAEARSLSAALTVADQVPAWHALVLAELGAGRVSEAARYADELRALTERSPAPLVVEALWLAGTARTLLGELAVAGELLGRAIARCDGHADPAQWARLRLAAAAVHLQADQPRAVEAAACLAEAEPIVALAGDDRDKHQLALLRGHLAVAGGQRADPRALPAQVVEQPLVLPPRDRIQFTAMRARVLILSGRAPEGVQLLRELAEQAERARDSTLAARIWRDLATALACTGHEQPSPSADEPD